MLYKTCNTKSTAGLRITIQKLYNTVGRMRVLYGDAVDLMVVSVNVSDKQFRGAMPATIKPAESDFVKFN